MAYFTKEIYERKESYAARKMRENCAIENELTEDQKDVIVEICSIRHRVHSDPEAAKALFYTGFATHNEYWNLVDTEIEENYLHKIIDKAGLPPLHWKCNCMDYLWDELTWEMGRILEPEDIFDEVMKLSFLLDKWNSAIEDWLREIDEKNGTSFCPTGMSRVFY